MSDAALSILRIVIIIWLTVFPLDGFTQSQVKVTDNNTLQPSDTIDYIPCFYDGALEYNLMIAASKDLSSEIDRLIGLGANLYSSTDEGATPLVFAVANNHPDAVRTLLKYSPAMDDITSSYETPLLIAVKNNFTDICEILIRAGADIDFNDNNGATSLHYASLYGYTELVDMLLYYDAAIDFKTDEGITPLHTAVWAGWPVVTEILIKNGANMESRDNQGFTPFLLAASCDDTTIMEMLRNYGVDIYTKNLSDHNALTLAIAGGNKETVKYLLDKGDKWKNADSLGHDPYVVASKYQRRELVEILRGKNVRGRIKYKTDQVAFSSSARFTGHDYFSGFSFSLKEPYLNGGLIFGTDMKLWYTRVLMKDSENLYHQYMDKGALVYAGLFKDFNLTNKPDKGNFIISASLSGGYTFGNKLKGTQVTPDNSFKLIPSVSLKWTKKALSVFSGMDYINTDYYKTGPVWFRLGLSYNYYFDNVRTSLKKIKWQ